MAQRMGAESAEAWRFRCPLVRVPYLIVRPRQSAQMSRRGKNPMVLRRNSVVCAQSLSASRICDATCRFCSDSGVFTVSTISATSRAFYLQLAIQPVHVSLLKSERFAKGAHRVGLVPQLS